MDSIVSSKSTEAKQLARQGMEQNLPPKQTRPPLPLLLSPILLLWSWHSRTANSAIVDLSPLHPVDVDDDGGHGGEHDEGQHHTCIFVTHFVTEC